MPHEGMIDLGKSPEKVEPTKPNSEPKKYYPTFHVRDVEGLHDLPEGEFNFTGKGRLVSYSENIKEGTCTCEIELMAMRPEYKKQKKAKGADERLEDSLDKIAKKKSGEYEDEE